MSLRIYKFDSIKVWCMLLVIIVHTLNNSYGSVGQEMIRFFCLCYTMPMFAFISGYFSKPDSSFRKNVTTLLIPCILFTLVNDGVQLLVCPNYHFTLTTPGFAMWYLWALFVYRISLPYLLKIPNIIILSFVLTWIVGFIPQINRTMSLSRIICFLPYFLLGYKIANEKYFHKWKRIILTPINKWGGVILLFLIFLIWWMIIYIRPGYTIATGFDGGYGLSIMGMILRMALQATILITGFLVIRLFPNKKLWFTRYGVRTMNVYLLHSIIVLPLAYQVFPPFVEADWLERIMMIALPTVLCIPLFSRVVDKTMKLLLGAIK